MEESDIIEKLNTVFSKELKKPVSLSVTTTAADVPGWDSLTHIMIIDSTEKLFSVKFKLSEVIQFNNIGDMVACIKKKQSK